MIPKRFCKLLKSN